MADISKIILPNDETVYDLKDATARSSIPTNISQLTNDVGYMTGMTILSYGSSTWNDFLTAYNAKHVVYCKASSNSNPATGDQGRMAFMAFVNISGTTPTSVEFQYYRSVSSHTDAQQGDQVYIYKLENSGTNGKWTVTVREAYTKIVAGSGLGSSYSNGALTITNSGVLTETDPVFSASAAAGIQSSDITAWNGKYDLPSGGIPATDLDSSVQTSLGKADTALQSAPVTSVNTKTGAVTLTASDVGAGTYSKPSGGIPKTDLASAVQTSLEKADNSAPLASPALTGTPTAPTAANGTNTTQIATTAFVQNAFASADAMIFKGTIGTGGTVTSLPNTHNAGWTYRVITASTYAGVSCEVGDLIICIKDGTAAANADWTVAQTNIDGAVTGPSGSVSGNVVTFDGTTGKIIQDSGFTIAKSVPSDAVFTDTKALGSMTGTLGADHGGTGQTSLNAAMNALINSLSTGTSAPADDDYMITQYVNGGTSNTNYYRRKMSQLWTYISGKISSVLGLTASTYGGSAAQVNGHTVATDVPANAVFTDTTYSVATTSSAGLMSATDKSNLDTLVTDIEAALAAI